MAVFCVGLAGSLLFVLPEVVDPGLANDGTLGFTLLDLFGHWAFGYGLLICGFFELIILGWLYDLDALLAFINENSRIKLGAKFRFLVRYVLPVVILGIIVLSAAEEVTGGLYGGAMETGPYSGLHITAFLGWIAFAFGGAAVLTLLRRRDEGGGTT